MELILVRNLCETFCFSIQFVIFIELISTVVLPIAILLKLSVDLEFNQNFGPYIITVTLTPEALFT